MSVFAADGAGAAEKLERHAAGRVVGLSRFG